MTAEETLNLISKQWCNLEDLKKLGQLGRKNELKLLTNNKIIVNFMLKNILIDLLQIKKEKL